MITDAQAEAANDFIRDNADKYAQAKANRTYLDEFRKSKKAILMQEVDGAEHIKAAFAYSHEEYLGVLAGRKEAIYEEEKIKWQMVAAESKIEIWRTQAANNRKGI